MSTRRRNETPEEKKARKKAAKQAKRQPKETKPCSWCDRAVDLLIRCQADSSKNWVMLCGRCWKKASGGVPDGTHTTPHYAYGGLWKVIACWPINREEGSEMELSLAVQMVI